MMGMRFSKDEIEVIKFILSSDEIGVKVGKNEIGVRFFESDQCEIFLKYFVASIRIFTISNGCFSI